MRPQIRKRRARATPRDTVLRAARELFFRHGYQGVSVDAIARRAGVSKPTIYSHFSGKEQLFATILREACDILSAPLQPRPWDSRPLREVLIEQALVYAEVVLDPSLVSLHRLFVAEAERFPALAQRYFDAGPHKAHRTIATFFEGRIKTGEIECNDPMLAAEHFATLVLGPLRQRMLFAVSGKPDAKARQRHVEAAVDLFLYGLVPPSKRMADDGPQCHLGRNRQLTPLRVKTAE